MRQAYRSPEIQALPQLDNKMWLARIALKQKWYQCGGLQCSINSTSEASCLPVDVALTMNIVKPLQNVPQYECYGRFRKAIGEVTRQQVSTGTVRHQWCHHNHLGTWHEGCMIWQDVGMLQLSSQDYFMLQTTKWNSMSKLASNYNYYPNISSVVNPDRYFRFPQVSDAII